MDLRKELIEYTKYIMDEITDGDLYTIDEYIENRNSINRGSTETQADRQNEQGGNKNCGYDECQDGLIMKGRVAHKCPSCWGFL